MTPSDPTGYDPDTDEPEYPVRFKLERFDRMYSDTLQAVLKRNNEAVGILRLRSEEEYEWLKSKIDGTLTRPRPSDIFEKERRKEES